MLQDWACLSHLCFSDTAEAAHGRHVVIVQEQEDKAGDCVQTRADRYMSEIHPMLFHALTDQGELTGPASGAVQLVGNHPAPTTQVRHEPELKIVGHLSEATFAAVRKIVGSLTR